MSKPLEPTASDLAEMRDQATGNVSFEPTDAQLREVCRLDPQLIPLARMWSWGDTEVRDQLCAALEALGPANAGEASMITPVFTRELFVRALRTLARVIAAAVSGQRQPGPARPRHGADHDDPWGGWRPPHPLDVNVRQIPHQTVSLSVEGRVTEFYAARCPAGHGLVVWSDYHLPFEVTDLDALEAWAARPAAG
jgi:hypothetical protein